MHPTAPLVTEPEPADAFDLGALALAEAIADDLLERPRSDSSPPPRQRRWRRWLGIAEAASPAT
jgi:hypothetical protein